MQLKDAQPYVQLTYSLCDDIATANALLCREAGSFCLLALAALGGGRSSKTIYQRARRQLTTLMASSSRKGRQSFALDGSPAIPRLGHTYNDSQGALIHGSTYMRDDCRNSLAQVPSRSVIEYIPLVDYLFRYDRGGFWVAKYSYRYFLVPFNRITRFILNPLMHTRVMYRALHHSGLSNYYFLQDVAVPFDKVEEFTEWLHHVFSIYPLWLCPLRLARDSHDAAHGLHSAFASLAPENSRLMNFGVWGPGSTNRREFILQNQMLERKVEELGGKKWLYANVYYTEDVFWAHYDRKSYDAVRAKYGASWMPSVYDKVRVDVEQEDQELRQWIPRLLAPLLEHLAAEGPVWRPENDSWPRAPAEEEGQLDRPCWSRIDEDQDGPREGGRRRERKSLGVSHRSIANLPTFRGLSSETLLHFPIV